MAFPQRCWRLQYVYPNTTGPRPYTMHMPTQTRPVRNERAANLYLQVQAMPTWQQASKYATGRNTLRNTVRSAYAGLVVAFTAAVALGAAGASIGANAMLAGCAVGILLVLGAAALGARRITAAGKR